MTNRFDPVALGGAGGTRSLVGVAAATLPFTGSPLAMLLKIATWLLVIGAACLAMARLRRRRTT